MKKEISTFGSDRFWRAVKELIWLAVDRVAKTLYQTKRSFFSLFRTNIFCILELS